MYYIFLFSTKTSALYLDSIIYRIYTIYSYILVYHSLSYFIIKHVEVSMNMIYSEQNYSFLINYKVEVYLYFSSSTSRCWTPTLHYYNTLIYINIYNLLKCILSWEFLSLLTLSLVSCFLPSPYSIFLFSGVEGLLSVCLHVQLPFTLAVSLLSPLLPAPFSIQTPPFWACTCLAEMFRRHRLQYLQF